MTTVTDGKREQPPVAMHPTSAMKFHALVPPKPDDGVSRITHRASRSFSPRRFIFTSRKHLHPFAQLLKICKRMSVSLCAKHVAICLAVILSAGTALGRGFGVQGGEYQPGGLLPGDQINPQL